MLFDPKPKTRPDDFFNMEEQLSNFRKFLKEQLVRLIVIKGLRRTGKTSLALVGLNSEKIPYIYIDCRSIEPISYTSFQKILISNIEQLASKLNLKGRIRSLIKRIRKIELAGIHIALREQGISLAELFKALPPDRELVLLLDEAQILTPLRGIVKLLAYIYDNIPQVKIVVTGSEIGVLNNFLGLENPKSPLYGRPYAEITTGKLNRIEAIEFLKKGLNETGLQPNEKYLEEAINKLDGIIGWLTYYGWNIIKNNSYRAGLEETLTVGSKLVLEELNTFLITRGTASHKYRALLRSLIGTPKTWSEIKREAERLLNIKIPNNQFTHYLKELVKYGFIEKTGKYYKLSDPMLEYALLHT